MDIATKFKSLSRDKQLAALGKMSDEQKVRLRDVLAGAAPTEVAPEPKYLQERGEGVSGWDRFVAKNFTQNPEKAFNHLQKGNPELEFSKKDDQVFFRPRDSEEPFKVLDPKGFDLEDITDVVYDMGSGLVENAAMVAGGAAGGVAAGPPGLVAGGMAASGVAGAAMEGLRNLGGQALGVDQDLSVTDMAVTGGLSAALTPLGGFGKAPAKNMVAGAIKTARKSGMSNTAAKKVGKEVADSGLASFLEGGALGLGFNTARKGTAKVAEQLTGVRAKVWNNLVEKPKELLDQIKSKGADRYANDKLVDTENTVQTELRKRGQDLADQINDSGQIMDISKAKKVIRDEINAISKQDTILAADKEKLSQLNKLYQDTFVTDQVPLPGGGFMVKEVPDQVEASLAFRIQKDLDDGIDYLSDQFRPQKSNSDQLVSSKMMKARKEIKNSLDKIKGVDDAKERYATTASDLDFLRNHLRDKKNMSAEMSPDAFIDKGLTKLQRMAGDIDKGKKHAYDRLTKIDDNYGTDITDVGDDVASLLLRETAGINPKSLQGVTATQRGNLTKMIGISAGITAAQKFGFPTVLGYGVGGTAGMIAGSPWTMKKMMSGAAAAQKYSPSASVIRPGLRVGGFDDKVRQSFQPQNNQE